MALRVSIHAPREGCDLHLSTARGDRDRFNSRTPGGVRLYKILKTVRFTDVSIHAPREGCDSLIRHLGLQGFVVSIHAPREGCDMFVLDTGGQYPKFQFTHPGRGATLVSAAY